VAVRRLQDAALLAETDKTRCPLDLELPKAIGGNVQPATGGGAASGTSVGKAAPGSSLLSLQGSSYRCAYQRDGKPLFLVVVAVPQGQEPVAAADGLATPLQEAGLDSNGAAALVRALQGAKAGKGVPAPSGSAAGATSTLPGGGAAAVAIVAPEGGPAAKDLAGAAGKLAATLKG
jgi:hypothetical protein